MAKGAKLRKMLGKADSPYILSLMRLIETQSKQTIIRWCVDYATAAFLPIYVKSFPQDDRPTMALAAADAWLRGEMKLPEAKQYILAVHAAAREAESAPAAQAAARAIGQAASTIHMASHSLGLAFYGAAATAYDRVGLEQHAEVYDDIAAKECASIESALARIAVPDEKNPAKIKWYC